jgi:hypothetical protein
MKDRHVRHAVHQEGIVKKIETSESAPESRIDFRGI